MNKKITAVIADDEPLARKGLRLMLKKEPDIELIAESEDGPQAVADINNHEPDLVFLDVQMPGMSGFDVIGTVGLRKMPLTIFITACDKHALEAFRVHAIDYLLKPIDAEHFRGALDRARAILRGNDAGNIHKNIERLIGELHQGRMFSSRFVIKTAGRATVVQAEDIEWCEAEDDYVALHVRGKKHLLKETLTLLETRLDPEQFIRVHRSVIVKIDYIKELKPMFNGDQLIFLVNGKELPLSRTYRKRVFEILSHR